MANKNLKLKLKLNLLNDSKYLYTISQIQGQHTENTELNRNTNYPMKKKMGRGDEQVFPGRRHTGF